MFHPAQYQNNLAYFRFRYRSKKPFWLCRSMPDIVHQTRARTQNFSREIGISELASLWLPPRYLTSLPILSLCRIHIHNFSAMICIFQTISLFDGVVITGLPFCARPSNSAMLMSAMSFTLLDILVQTFSCTLSDVPVLFCQGLYQIYLLGRLLWPHVPKSPVLSLMLSSSLRHGPIFARTPSFVLFSA